MFKKTIKIFPAPHVEVRLHASKEIRRQIEKNGKEEGENNV